MTSWREYWDSDNPIYVSQRHKLLHYRLIARDIAAFVPSAEAHVLDHGSGEALSADLVARASSRLYLCDASPTTRARLATRFVNEPKIHVIPPETLDIAIPDASLDLVVANSLAQYLTRDELRATMAVWRAKLKDGGIVILADIIPPDLGPVTDARALLSFAFSGGFLAAAVAGLVRTAFSDYRQLRSKLGLTTYSASDMDRVLHEADFVAVRQLPNLGHNPARLCFVAQRRD